MSNIIPFYAYKITCIPTGEFYYGSRCAHVHSNRAPEDDLGIHYFSSSKIVKTRIKQYDTTDFLYEITDLNLDKDAIFWIEQDYIKNNIKNLLCLNVHYIDRANNKVFNQFGTTWWVNPAGTLRRSVDCPGEGWLLGGTNTGKKGWIKDGEVIFDDKCPGIGWLPGGTNKDKKWWYNKDGKRRRSVESPGPEWSSSDLKSWSKDGEIQFSETSPGEGWILGGPNKGKRKWVDQNGNKTYSNSSPGPDWITVRKAVIIDITIKKWWVNQSGKLKRSINSPGPEWVQGKSLPKIS
jgi:hypothetical protein